MSIIAFPFAGGNRYSFEFLRPYLEEGGVELKVLEYPGRGRRIREPLLASLEEIEADAFERLEKVINNTGEYLIYGHSMGALIGYLMSKKLEKSPLLTPRKLIVSGREAPCCKQEPEIRSNLESDAFWKEVDDLGGLPKEVLKIDELKEFYDPILRSDFSAIEGFDNSDTKKLNIPIDVFYGREEGLEYHPEVDKWNEATTKQVRIYEKSGDHFFIYEHAASIANHMLQAFS